jgi:hypothetical protein
MDEQRFYSNHAQELKIYEQLHNNTGLPVSCIICYRKCSRAVRLVISLSLKSTMKDTCC